MNKEIKFGFWNYLKSGMLDKSAVNDWVEMGCNLPMSPTFDPRTDDKNNILEILDACEEKGIQLIVCDKRTHFRTYRDLGEARFIKGVREAYADFGHHKATFGFFVGDEPTLDEQELFINTLKIVIKEMPKLTPFGNFVPYWGGCDHDLGVGRTERYFDELVDRVLKESGTPLIGYDQYTQCLQDNQNVDAGINSYFFCLDKFQAVTKKYGIPFYVSLLAVGHWGYRVPTEDDIRWQIYTSLAHGARGVIWFHMYNRAMEGSYRGAPIYFPKKEKTDTFYSIARQQDNFNRVFKAQFDKMELTAVYHLGHFYDPSKRFCADDTISDLQGKFPYPIIVSYYKEFDSEKRWVSIVNGHQRYANRIRITFISGKADEVWLAPGEMKLFDLDKYE